MKHLHLPNTELEVSQLAYGMGSFDGTIPLADGLKLVEQYLDAGGNFLDTAHCYCFWTDGGTGSSERFVGEVVRAFGRDGLIIATKGGHHGMDGYPRPDDFLLPELVRQDLHQSLDRLGLPSVDLYFLHRDDPRVPVAEIIDSCNGVVQSGQVRYLGVSNWTVERFVAANKYAHAKDLQPFVMLQNQWSLAQPTWHNENAPGAVRFIEDREISVLKAEQIAVAAYSSTANGYFATSVEHGKAFDSPNSRRRLAAARSIAESHHATPTQIALAYLMNQPSLVIPIVGTRDALHLAEALGSIIIELSQEDLLELIA